MDYTISLPQSRTNTIIHSLNPSRYINNESKSTMNWVLAPEQPLILDLDCIQEGTSFTDNYNVIQSNCFNSAQIISGVLTKFVTENQINFMKISEMLQTMGSYFLISAFAMENIESVQLFLRDNFQIKEIILEAKSALVTIFGESTKFSLAVKPDKDLGDFLVCYIKPQDEDLGLAIQKMNMFNSTWLINNISKIKLKLLFRLI